MQGDKIAHGTFIPGPPHVLRGTFEFWKSDGTITMITSEDFYFDGSPAPGFALTNGSDTSQLERTEIGRLKGSGAPDGKVIEITGKHTFYVPSSLDINDFDTVILWCFKIPFTLGHGRIERI